MTWSPFNRNDKPANKNGSRDHDEDNDPTVRSLQGGLIAVLFLWGVLALAVYADVISQIFGEYDKAITALGTVTVAVFTGTLWRVSGRQADLIERTLVVGERAFVFSERIQSFFEPIPGTGDFSFTFRPTWKNSGHTQTKRMKTRVNSEFRDTPLPDDFDFTRVVGGDAPALLGPGVSVTGGIDRAFSSAELDELRDAKKFLYLWGWAEYNDIFPNTARHITRYCFQVRIFGDTRQPKAGTEVFNIIYPLHFKGNSADEDDGD